MALGAFLAGVLLAESEYRHELETDLAPFKGLLLGLFFIAVGMGLDLNVLRQQPGLVLLLLWLLTQLTPETLLFGAGDLRDVLSDVPGVLHPAQTFIRAEAVVAAANALAVGLLASTLLRQRIDNYRGLLLLFGTALLVRTLAYAVLGSGLLSSSADALSWLTPGAATGALAGMEIGRAHV